MALKSNIPTPTALPTLKHAKPVTGRTMWFALGLIAGMALAGIASVEAQLADGKPDFALLADRLDAYENVLIALAVDTERSAIGIAELNQQMGQLKRRLKALEAPATK